MNGSFYLVCDVVRDPLMLQLILIMNCFLSCRSEQLGIAVFLSLRSAF